MILDLKSCDWDVMCHIYIELGFRMARGVSASFLPAETIKI